MNNDNPFVYRKASPEQGETIRYNMGLCERLYEELIKLPESRERALALTKLEEAAMWANKCVAFRT